MSLSRIIKSDHYEALKTIHTIQAKKNELLQDEVSQQPVVESEQRDQGSAVNELLSKAKIEAEKILADAKEERNRLIQAAEQQADEWRLQQQEEWNRQFEEAAHQGYQQGYEEGFGKGQEQATSQFQEHLEIAQNVIEEAHKYKSTVIAEAEPFLVGLSVSIARRIIGQELKVNEESILSIVKQALIHVEGMKRITICVHPEQFHPVQKHREEWMLLTDHEVEVKVMPDRKVPMGSCIIRSEEGTIDAQVEVQLSQIKEQLMSLAMGSGE